MNKEKEKIEKLKETVEILKKEREKINKKITDFIQANKKELNAVFEIKLKIRDILEKNKKCILRIKDIKKERNEFNKRVTDINNDIIELKKKLGDYNQEEGKDVAIVELKNKISKLEWEIQTKPHSLKKEDQMQEQLTCMVNELKQIKRKTKYLRKIKRIKNKKKELKKEADEKHKELLELSVKSEKIYASLIEEKAKRKVEEEKAKPLLEKLNFLRKTANSVYKKYTEYMDLLKKEEKNIQKEIKDKQIEEKHEEEKKIYNSFKSGEKLSLSDLILIEKKLDDKLNEEEKLIEKNK